MRTVKRYIITGGIIVVVLIAFVMVGKYMQGRKAARGVQETELTKNKFKGNEKAPIRIVIYSDFQCPSCAHGSAVAESIFADLKNKVSVEYRYFPLQMHKWAWEAAAFAECAADQDKFWEYHDLLFKKQAEWSKEGRPTASFLEFAMALKLDMEKIGTCVTDEKTLQRIQKDKESGEQLQVSSTPTVFINDKRFVGGKQFDADGKKYIAEELKKTGIDWKYTSTPLPPSPIPAQISSNPKVGHESHPHPVPVTAQPAVNTVPAAVVEKKEVTHSPGTPRKTLGAGETAGQTTATSKA